jgi:hypothetical protein
MLRITQKIQDGILEVILPKQHHASWEYKIVCAKGEVKLKGAITGYTQRTCLYVGDLKKGQYEFIMNDDRVVLPFTIG